jgi:hypothetical protein
MDSLQTFLYHVETLLPSGLTDFSELSGEGLLKCGLAPLQLASDVHSGVFRAVYTIGETVISIFPLRPYVASTGTSIEDMVNTGDPNRGTDKSFIVRYKGKSGYKPTGRGL